MLVLRCARSVRLERSFVGNAAAWPAQPDRSLLGGGPAVSLEECISAMESTAPFVALAGGTVGGIAGGIKIMQYWSDRHEDEQILRDMEHTVLLNYSTAMSHELLARDYFVQGSQYQAKSALEIAIPAFKFLETHLAFNRERVHDFRARKLRSTLAKHARDLKYVPQETTDAQLLWTVNSGLASSQYHMAQLLALEGDMKGALDWLQQSERDSTQVKQEFNLVSPEKDSRIALMKQIASWEVDRTKLKKLILSGNTHSIQFTGESAFFAMRYKSRQAWISLEEGEIDQAVSAMKSCMLDADELLSKSLVAEALGDLVDFEWPQLGSTDDRLDVVEKIQQQALVQLSELWTDKITLVDVLHDESRIPLEKAERVRLALRKQVTSRLTCLLFLIAQNKDRAALQSAFEAWGAFKETPAFKVFCIVDETWWRASKREAVCDSVFGFCFEGKPLSFDAASTYVTHYKAVNDWRWLLINLRYMQESQGQALPGSPERWAILARHIQKFHPPESRTRPKTTSGAGSGITDCAQTHSPLAQRTPTRE